MKSAVTVLVTGVGSFCGVNIIHSLRHASKYRIVGSDIFDASAGLFLADKAYVVPREGPDGRYIEAILDICRRENVQALIPGFDAELPYLSDARQQFADAGVVPIIGDPHFVRIGSDKLETQRFLEANGFPYLRTYEPEQRDEAITQLGFPLVVKPREAWGARGFKILNTPEALDQAVAEVVEAGWLPILQEYISEEEGEYTNSVMVASDYDILGSICMRRELEKGSSRRIFVDHYPDLRKQVETIARRVHTRGPVNMQCRLRNGQAYVFEFNARFSTTNVVRVVCGFNEVDTLVKNFLTGAKTYISTYEPKVVVMYQDYVYANPIDYKALRDHGFAKRIGQVKNALAGDRLH
jgi:carbamoyl-phosphate synthase large subunit